MRRLPLFWTLLPLLAASHGIASAQAMVENALGAGAAANAAGPMKGIGGALNNLEKTLNKTLNGTEAPPVAAAPKLTAPSAGAAPAVATMSGTFTAAVMPARRYEDPKLIEAGTGYHDLVQRFGPAALEITTAPGLKTLSYMSREGALQVELVDDKVNSVFDVVHGTIVKK